MEAVPRFASDVATIGSDVTAPAVAIPPSAKNADSIATRV